MVLAPPATPTLEPAAAPAPAVGLYVHVPFCISVCPYCDFVVLGGAAARGPRSLVNRFLEALRAEISLRADALDEVFGRVRPVLRSVYLGGGTPSLLAADEIGGILDLVRARFGVAHDAEVTLEANPGASERGDLRVLARSGVTRLSIGAQRLDLAELRRLGRRHTPADVRQTVEEARDAGIGSVGIDLLYDIPDDDLAAWARTLEAAIELRPDHLSLYALSLDDPDAEGLAGAGGDHLPVSRGARAWRARARSGQDEERAAAAYEHAFERLAEAGFRPYEISNWARPGHESRHNLAYWQRRPIEAVGPGAHAFDGVTRRWNAARFDAWAEALVPAPGAAGRPALPPGGSEMLDRATAAAEAVILALRTDGGVQATAGDVPPLSDVAPWAMEHGLLERTGDDRLVLTTRGRLLSNEVFCRLG